MRWLGFAICAIIVLTLHTTLAWRLAIRGVRPDWMLALAVFFALHARSMDVLIGAWLLGAAMDIMTIEHFGLLSGCYAVATLAIYAARDYVFRDNPLTHFVVTFAAAVAVGSAMMTYRIVVAGGAGSDSGLIASAGNILFGAVYTAVWAPPLHYVLLKFPNWLGVLAPRRSRSARTRHV